ncbi:MAG: hypothetical protein FD123_4173 [Bacteroidetes bacterium]|nr:MAG: hypothetical protein FD123_4173 [Bacteroidota bacterium]
MKKHLRFTIAFFFIINLVLGQTKSKPNIQYGTFEFHLGKNYDWWRLTINLDSSFVFEDLTFKNYDTTSTISADKGRWKYMDNVIVLYAIENIQKDSIANFPYLLNTHWKFGKDRIYSIDPIYAKTVYFIRQDTFTKSKKHRLLRYYTYGLGAYGGCDDQCEKEVSKKYGFINKEKAGCVVRPGQQKRWDKHNRKVNEKLKARNGGNWRDKYYEEINQCCKK